MAALDIKSGFGSADLQILSEIVSLSVATAVVGALKGGAGKGGQEKTEVKFGCMGVWQ